MTWLPEPETGEIPRPVADRLDWVITLGGDGTVLWTCSILGNGPVPPLVPFAMGSLGFMTPFAMDRMQRVLTKVGRLLWGMQGCCPCWRRLPWGCWVSWHPLPGTACRTSCAAAGSWPGTPCERHHLLAAAKLGLVAKSGHFI